MAKNSNKKEEIEMQAEIVVKELSESIEYAATGMKKLLNSGKIKERALLLLIRDVTGLRIGEIQKVLRGVATLDEVFLKKGSK